MNNKKTNEDAIIALRTREEQLTELEQEALDISQKEALIYEINDLGIGE